MIEYDLWYIFDCWDDDFDIFNIIELVEELGFVSLDKDCIDKWGNDNVF